MGYRVAVVGATGAVGREMLKTLAERRFPVDEVAALASGRSTGQQVSFGEKKVLKVRNLETFDFRGWDIGLFSPGAAVSAVHAPRAAAAGCVVIDNTSQFRMDPDIPLVVPEVNPQALRNFGKRNIIANPNCSTIQMVVALKPLHDQFRIKRVVVATYQSVSGAGKEGMDELFNHTKSSFVYETSPPQQFTKEIAFNCIPHIDKFLDDGSTKEEWKMVVETQEDPRPEHRGARHLRARAGVHRPRRGGERRVRAADHRRRGARLPARRAGRRGGGCARGRRLRHAARMRRRGRRVCQPHPQGPDGAARPVVLVRIRQSAQGRGAERGADRRDADRAADAGEGGLIRGLERQGGWRTEFSGGTKRHARARGS